MNGLPSFDEVLRPIRSLSHFGSRLELRRCTSFQFMPDVLVHVATGLSLARELQRKDYTVYRALVAADRASRTATSLRTATMAILKPIFDEVFRVGPSLESLMQTPPWQRPPYRMLFRGRHRLRKLDRRVLVRTAAEMRLAFSLDRDLGQAGHAQRYADVVGASVAYWHAVVGSDAGIHIDRFLMHVAWIDHDLSRLGEPGCKGSTLVSLAAPAHRPMRNWFDGLLEQTRCKDLVDLEQLLYRRGVSAPHQSLKHWASTTQPLRHHRAMDLVRGCRPHVNYEQERRRYWCARLLTFVQDLACAMLDSAPAEQHVRHLVHRRLIALRTRLGDGPVS